MLYILFGTPAVGKSFIGHILEKFYDFYFYDADIDLTEAMKESIEKQAVFTQAMRDEYFHIVTQKLIALQKQFKNIVMTQALAKEKNRQQLQKKFPEARFLWVQSDIEKINARLTKRSDWVNIQYAKKIRSIFDVPKLPHTIIDNNVDEDHVVQQLKKIMPV